MTTPSSNVGAGASREWQPIESAPDLERVLVAGWQPKSGNVRGYWWWYEDVIADGKAEEHPSATHWHPVIKADFPTPPAGETK